MSAKKELFDRLEYLSSAVLLPAVIDVGIAPSTHNGVASLLRKGLAILAFNMLEDFVKNKSLEALTSISNSRIPFSKLTETLQEASISGALTALAFRAEMEKKDGGDWKNLIQEEALKINSTKNAVYEISKFSLVSSRSNIAFNEVNELLKAFGISGGWAKIKEISDAIGGGILDPCQTFKNASTRRHSAAHSPSFNYDYNWLADLKNDILAIAASIDILLTARCRQISSDLTKKIAEHNIDHAVKFRFIEKNGNTIYREVTSIGGRARRLWTDLDQALLTIKPQLAARNEFLIIINQTRRLDDWQL